MFENIVEMKLIRYIKMVALALFIKNVVFFLKTLLETYYKKC